MLENKDRQICIKIKEHCNRIESDLKNMDYDKFIVNDTVKDSVSHNLAQVGELIDKLSEDAFSQLPSISKPMVKSLRNRIVHGYGEVDFEIIYETSVNDIPYVSNCLDVLFKNNNMYVEGKLSIDLIIKKVKPILEKYKINEAYIFGSYARDEQIYKSDIDILCSNGDINTVLQEAHMLAELTKVLHKDVDIVYLDAIPSKEFYNNIKKDLISIF